MQLVAAKTKSDRNCIRINSWIRCENTTDSYESGAMVEEVIDAIARSFETESPEDVDINTISYEEMKTGHILITTFPKEKNADIFRFSKDIDESIDPTVITQPHSFLETLKPYKDEKIIIFCYGGGTARSYANLARLFGFEAYGMGIMSLTNEDLLDQKRFKELSNKHSITINTFGQRGKRNKDLYLFFEVGDSFDEVKRVAELEDEEAVLDQGVYRRDETPLSELYANISKERILESNMLCSSGLECKILQYWLHEQNLSGKVNDIYHIYK